MLRKLYFTSIATLLAILTMTQLVGCSQNTELHVNDLTESEEKQITEFANNVTVEDGVGQLLMVGFPADINTVRDSESGAADETIVSLGIGSAIVNNSTYYDDGKLNQHEYLSKIISFNNAVQEKTLNSKLKLPLLIATDFEGPNFTSIKRGLVLPPSALAISASQDAELIKKMGSYVGLELKNAGIQVILGPVLDIYNVRQGNKNVLQDRCFAATADGVARTASHYIKGLKESRIVIFAKHFPSHGSVETNPHAKVIPIYEGSEEQFNSDIKPFEVSRKSIDGIMTAHIEVPCIREKQMATFSEEVVNSLRKKKEFNDQILITDDLSSMGAVLTYMDKRQYSYSDIAKQAFAAGHDLLLFAHVSRDSKGDEPFTSMELRKVVADLAKYIKSSESNVKQFRSSLRRIIKLKAIIAKDMKQSVQTMLSRDKKQTIFHTQHDGRQAIQLTESAFAITPDQPSISSNYSFGEKLVKDILRKSAVKIVSKQQVEGILGKRNGEEKVIFAIYENELYKFREEFGPKFNSAVFLGIPSKKDTKSFQQLETSINTHFKDADLLIYTAHDDSDAHLLRRLRDKNQKRFSESTIILCHNSPVIFDNEVLTAATIIGLFTKHSAAFDIDIEILKGTLAPRDLVDLPINVGESGKFYNVSNTKWVPPADISAFKNLFSSSRHSEEDNKALAKNHLLISKDLVNIALLVVAILAIAIISILAHYVPKYMRAWKIENNKQIGMTLEILTKKPVNTLFPTLVFIALTLVLLFNEITNQTIDNIGKTISKTQAIGDMFKK